MKKLIIKKDKYDAENILDDDFMQVSLRIDEAVKEARTEKENDENAK